VLATITERTATQQNATTNLARRSRRVPSPTRPIVSLAANATSV
jgi:hypothetical protein